MSDSDDDEIEACKMKGMKGSLLFVSEGHACGCSCWLMWALLLFVSDIGFAVHKQQDMIPLDDDDGERSSFHAMENGDLLHPSIFLQFPKMFPFFLGGLGFSEGVGGWRYGAARVRPEGNFCPLLILFFRNSQCMEEATNYLCNFQGFDESDWLNATSNVVGESTTLITQWFVLFIQPKLVLWSLWLLSNTIFPQFLIIVLLNVNRMYCVIILMQHILALHCDVMHCCYPMYRKWTWFVEGQMIRNL